MIFGLCRAEIHIPDAGSLKARRGVIKGLKERLRSRFNVSVAEIDHLDLWQRATLAIVIVSNEQKHANSVLSSVVKHMERDHRAQLLDYELSFF
ncbi:MAG: DUF503 domain-containing protein [Gemmatimonadetes bacterium]|nr:DUF503 domain-containing protein [Gemmatimonadota bacterium]